MKKKKKSQSLSPQALIYFKQVKLHSKPSTSIHLI